MQHQLWLARQTVLRRLGSPEDACVVSSDAELDAKLELFRSISDSSALLQRLAGEQRDKSSALAHEEASLGGFLREAAALNGGDASRALARAGKTISYLGAQRGTQRTPLLRLQRELDTFRGRGVSDTRATVSHMENARQSYRAALSWMKAASAKLDPDTGAGLHQYRKAQAQVRQSKALFDKLTLDCLQKVDLLAAARCNMFSHVLVNYQNSLLEFTTKAAETLNLTAQMLSETPSYEFSILKELSQAPVEEQNESLNPSDKDRILFFQEEFKDDKETSSGTTEPVPSSQEAVPSSSDETIESAVGNLIDSLVSLSEKSQNESSVNSDLMGLNLNDGSQSIGSFMPSQLLQDFTSDMLQTPTQPPTSPLSGNFHENKNETSPNASHDGPSTKKQDNAKKDRAMWFKLFAELDPLANPDAMPGINANQSHAA